MAEGVFVVDISGFESTSTAYVLLSWVFVSGYMEDHVMLVAISFYRAYVFSALLAVT